MGEVRRQEHEGMPPLISVIIPRQKHRDWFCTNWVLPAVEALGAWEVITVPGKGHPNKKRNHGAKKATGTYLFFCDDDVIPAMGCLDVLLDHIGNHAYAYCDSYGFTLPGVRHYYAGTYELRQKEWSHDDLRYRGTVTPMSLIRKDAFDEVGGFNEKLANGHMKDLALRLMDAAYSGVHVPYKLFLQFNLDDGITAKAMMR